LFSEALNRSVVEGGGEAEEQQIKLGDGADPADCLVIVEGI
jgi:hypothetical protein